MNRRGFFGRLIGAVAAVTVAKTLPAESGPTSTEAENTVGDDWCSRYDGAGVIWCSQPPYSDVYTFDIESMKWTKIS